MLRHLLALAHVNIEDRTTVEHALSHCEAGIELADAMHHASYRACASMASFDDQKFARRAKKLGLAPVVGNSDLTVGPRGPHALRQTPPPIE